VHWVNDYYSTLEEKGVPIGKAVTAEVSCVTPMMCAPTEAEAIARGVEGGNFFGYSLGHYYVFGEHEPGKTSVWDQYIERRSKVGYDPEAIQQAVENEVLGAKAASGDTTGLRGATGTPEQLREYIRRFEEAGVDQLIFVMQAGNNKHEHIMESLQLFADEVMPEFKEREPKRRAAKAKRLEPVIEKVMARKLDDAPRLPEGYSFPAMPKAMMKAAGNEQGEEWLEKFADERAAGKTDSTLGILG
jgi:hypothetical protein